MTRSKLTNISNQEFLQELEKRLVDDTFTQADSVKLMNLLGKYQQQFLAILQAANPQVYQWCQEKIQEKEQAKIDQETEELKKSLAKK